MEKQIKNRFEKVENRVDKIEKTIFRLSKKGKLVKCHKCGNSWITRSKKKLISCTSCGTKVKIEDKKVKKKTKKKDLYVKGKSWEDVAKKSGVF